MASSSFERLLRYSLKADLPMYFDFRVSMTDVAGRSLVGFGGATASISGVGGRERFLLGSGAPGEEERREITSIRVVEFDIISEWRKRNE